MLKRRLVLVGIFAAAAIFALSFAASGSSAATTSGPFAFVESVREFFGIVPEEIPAELERKHTTANQNSFAGRLSPSSVDSITSFGTPFTENFDGMGSSATATLPAGFKIGTDWATGTTATTLAYGTTGAGAVTGSSGGGTINWANGITATSTDRSLGFLNSGSFTSPRSIVLKISNNTGATISALDISFDYEKSRSGTRQFDWTFFHGGTSAPATAATAGDQSYPADANNTTISNPPLTTSKTVNLTGLSIANGTDYYLRWTFTGLGGSTNGQGIGIDNFSITATASGATAPVLTTPTATAITTTTATLGANITSDGGSAVTERGTVWKTTAGVTDTDNPLAEGGTATGVFTQARTGFPAGTQIFYKGYAKNTNGTGLSSEASFYTLSNEPTTHAASFTSAPFSSTQIDLSFSAASTITNASGYIILRRSDGTFPDATGVVDAVAPGSLSLPVGTTLVTTISNPATATYSDTGLTTNVTYRYALIPFGYNGSNSATYNYLTAPTIPTTSATTASASSLVLPVILSESPTISSLVNDPGPLTSAGGVSVWQIGVYDGGISGDPDTLPTIVTGLTIGKGASSTVTDFSSAILAADLFNGGTHLASGVIGPSTVTFSGFNFSVNDNQFASMSIRISLKTSGLTDNQSFQFNLAQSGITTAGAVTSSQIAPFTTFSSQAGQNKIDVAATKLAFGAQPVNVGTGAAMTPAPTVYAADANGNTDTDWATDIAVTATGSVLTGSPVSATPTSGTAAFSGLVFTTAGTGVTLNATSGALTDATSGTFDVLLVPLPGEIVINQFNPGYAGATDEYIEIVNLTNKTFDLSLLRIDYAAASGNPGSAGGILSGTLQPYSFWLLSPNPTVNVGQTVNLPADGSFTSGLAGGAGQIALRLVAAPNTKIDGVSYGTITGTNVYGEGTPTASPTSNAGFSRVPDGTDTNSNIDDFQAVANSAIYLRNSTGRIVPNGVSLPAGTYADISALDGSSIAGDVTINGRLTLGGVVTTGASTITLGCGGSSAGAGATSYVLGNVRKDFCATGAFSFPVGENGYTPVDTTITTLTTNPSSLTVRTYNATLGTFDPAQAMTRNWDITETGDLEATLSFTYLAGDVAGDEADYRVWRLETDAHLQTNLCPGAPCVDTVNHVIGPVTGVTQFSRWTGAGPLAPTAAAVSVAGRVTTADGRGIRNAVMTISGNGLAQPIRTITGLFGYYNFDGLNAGETYVLTVNSKSFAFQVPSRVINLNDNVTDADFIANP